MSVAKGSATKQHRRKEYMIVALRVAAALFLAYGAVSFLFSSSSAGRSEALLALIFGQLLIWNCRWLAEE